MYQWGHLICHLIPAAELWRGIGFGSKLPCTWCKWHKHQSVMVVVMSRHTCVLTVLPKGHSQIMYTLDPDDVACLPVQFSFLVLSVHHFKTGRHKNVYAWHYMPWWLGLPGCRYVSVIGCVHWCMTLVSPMHGVGLDWNKTSEQRMPLDR